MFEFGSRPFTTWQVALHNNTPMQVPTGLNDFKNNLLHFYFKETICICGQKLLPPALSTCINKLHFRKSFIQGWRIWV